MSPSWLVDGRFVGCDRRVDRFFLLSPNLALILFQPLPDIARWSVLGDALKVKSDVGGVVGGVTGSVPGVEFGLLLSSVARSASGKSEADPDADRLPPCRLLRLRPSNGSRTALGECEASSAEAIRSFGILSRERLCLTFGISSSACDSAGAGVTDSQKGTSTESFISSCTIPMASSSSEGCGGLDMAKPSRSKRSRTGDGRLTSRGL